MLQKKLGRRIAALRKTRQLTQIGLAKKIGCSEAFLNQLVRVKKGEMQQLGQQAFNRRLAGAHETDEGEILDVAWLAHTVEQTDFRCG
jgi:transcriptional regulator with XRE-family HTH domain